MSVLRSIKRRANQGREFFTVLYDTMVREGGEMASHETIRKRWLTCTDCRYFVARKNSCAVCGCKLRGVMKGFRYNLANKLAHKASRCPKGKWGKER